MGAPAPTRLVTTYPTPERRPIVGYESHWTGEVRITPPLTWAEIKNGRQAPGFQDLRLRTIETVEDTDSGQIRIVTADAVVPVRADAYNGYSVDEELQAAVDAHPGREFAGAIEARPCDPDGMPWRYVVRERRVVRQEPRLVWPDDTPADVCPLHSPTSVPCDCGHDGGADCHPKES